MAQTISIKSWERFQHYKDRDPPWIKLYRDLLTAESWVLGTDDSRLVQVACILLAARYQNATPLNFPLFRKVASLDLSAKEFDAALAHLASTDFLEIQGDADARKQPASNALATCASETEQSRAETEQIRPGELARKRAATRTCPDDFALTDEMIGWATSQCPGIDIDRETAAFKDYTFASAKTDWVKTWRNWMRKAKPAGNVRPSRYDELMGQRKPASQEPSAAALFLTGGKA
jgi:hypothetical protein